MKVFFQFFRNKLVSPLTAFRHRKKSGSAPVPDSPWTDYLYPKDEDPSLEFRELVMLDCEELVARTTASLLEACPGEDPQDTQRIAICIVMERMLALQHAYTPDMQEHMVKSLIAGLPELAEIREAIAATASER